MLKDKDYVVLEYCTDGIKVSKYKEKDNDVYSPTGAHFSDEQNKKKLNVLNVKIPQHVKIQEQSL